ncbi:MAG TPA: hypothetical protein H9671_00430 [Firmicutes bacterium]|nr:hypothetical protein [Bacillota bacterium]
MMSKIEIPHLAYLVAKNPYAGSLENFNYKYSPDGENIDVYAWYGMSCCESAEKKVQAVFPLTEEGLQQAAAWLESQRGNPQLLNE